MDPNKTCLVIGTGKSGLAATDALLARGWDVILFDGNENLDLRALFLSHPKLQDLAVFIKDFPDDMLDAFSVVVPSPGVPMTDPLLRRCAACGKTVWGEIELGYRFGNGRLCAITGTNGKTTTTALTGALLAEAFADVRVVGNIGDPYTAAVSGMTEDTRTVCEVSSFQLESVDTFHPDVTAILNMTPDHLDRHKTMEAYVRAKETIAARQGPDDVCVLNYEDPLTRDFGEQRGELPCPSGVVWFSSARALSDGFWFDGETGNIWRSTPREKKLVIAAEELLIPGLHNIENAMAAAACAEAMGVSLAQIQRGLRSFRAVEHRIEYIGTASGVTYYNDSKGTNPDAAIKAVQAMKGPVVLIGGGYDKHADFSEWVSHFKDKVRHLILIGETAGAIEAEALRQGFDAITKCQSLEEAVAAARKLAVEGDSVLLSPACASWDMFANYEERGDRFRSEVLAFMD